MTDYDKLLSIMDRSIIPSRIDWDRDFIFGRTNSLRKHITMLDNRKNYIRFSFDSQGNLLSISSLTDEM